MIIIIIDIVLSLVVYIPIWMWELINELESSNFLIIHVAGEMCIWRTETMLSVSVAIHHLQAVDYKFIQCLYFGNT